MRIAEINPASLSEAQRAIYDRIKAGPRGDVPAPLRVWLRSAEFAERAEALGAFCRYGTSLPPRLSELAILVMAAHWKAAYEWQVHAPIAHAQGVSVATSEKLRVGATPDSLQPDEAAVYRFAHELLNDRSVSAETYAFAAAILGEQAIVELVGLLGYYTLISMTIVAFELPQQETAQRLFSDGRNLSQE